MDVDKPTDPETFKSETQAKGASPAGPPTPLAPPPASVAAPESGGPLLGTTLIRGDEPQAAWQHKAPKNPHTVPSTQENTKREREQNTSSRSTPVPSPRETKVEQISVVPFVEHEGRTMQASLRHHPPAYVQNPIREK